MRYALLAIPFSLVIAASQVHGGEMALDVEGECQSISETDATGCRCRGLYYASKFGPDEGAAALHLVGRSYVSEPRSAATVLYERFGADRLNRVAYRILETQGEVVAFCPTSMHVAD
ncbi:hypothetical protein KHP60_17410 [Microvirga sp. 3-52]|uniref:hypothetical protein n=1 Tax=Microvirga sp. 3-52 TaxID=2792425 RepID=UPI001AC46F33|nr:hypothetical protein [Microvirga sp. 3-52]MBO1907070.1 hypothetical protein [Microvirga sp. 3-52]MBS7454112.1 hypothetical protein [Microvirga sp. 3-52]